MSSGAAVFVMGPAGSGKVKANLFFASLIYFLFPFFNSPHSVDTFWNIVKVLEGVHI